MALNYRGRIKNKWRCFRIGSMFNW